MKIALMHPMHPVFAWPKWKLPKFSIKNWGIIWRYHSV
jgi:hypothetical protein